MRVWRGWTWRRWLGAVGVLLFVAGQIMRLFPPLWFAAQYLSFAGIVVAALAVWLSTAIKGTRPSPMSVVGYLLAIAVLFLFPVILVSLATGGSGSILAYFAYFWRPRHIGLLRAELTGLLATPLLLVPFFLISLPEMLRMKVESGPAPASRTMDGQADGVARIKRLLPGWLAAGAALATGLYAFLLHFLGGPLAKLSLLQLIVAIAFAVALLVPPTGG
jgi:hypothetical protein